MEPAAVVLLCTCPSADVGAELARTLVTERLVACVNLVPGVRSIYRWDGQLCEDAETLLVLKANAADVDRIGDRVKALHPYTCPELIALPIVGGLPQYLGWLVAETQNRQMFSTSTPPDPASPYRV